MTMKMLPSSSARTSVPSRFRRLLAACLLPLVAAGLFVAPASAQTITSAVPGLISYQGKVSNAAGALVGTGTPVNRLVIFRIWSHQSNSTISDLVYSEQQTVTISEGEFSVLIGQGAAVSGTPLGYSETAKGPTTVTVATASVFGGASRFLGVTIDDGTGAADPEVSPRQQLVTSAFAFRAKYAESVGSNGANTLTALDNGNVGVGTANPGARLDVNGALNIFDSGKAFAGGLVSEAGAGMINFGINDTRFGSPQNNTSQGGFLRLNTQGSVGSNLFQFYARPTGSASLSEVMSITGAGNVGIGNTAPAQKLAVNGDTLTTGTAFLLDTNHSIRAIANGGVGISTFQVTDGIYLQQVSGNVGIGTTSPSAKLHVAGGITSTSLTTGSLNLSGPVATSGAVTTHSQGAWLEWNKAAGGGQTYLLNQRGLGGGGIIFGEVDSANAITENMRITLGGNVGIGTASPAGKLTVAGGSTELGIYPGTLNGVANTTAVTLDIPSTGTLSVWDNFVVSGNVGVGTSAPATTLDVRSATPIITIGTTSGTGGAVYFGNSGHGVKRGYFAGNDVGLYTTGGDVYLSGSGTSNGFFVVKNSGYVGIGTNTPSSPLHVAGAATVATSLQAYMDPDTVTASPTNQAFNGNYSIIGDARIRGAAFDVQSDRRIKNVLGTSSGPADLPVLMSIEVTDYTFKDSVGHSSRPQKKVIAQQVETVLPSAVSRVTEVLPDIFKKATVKDGWINLATDLAVGDRVRLLTKAERGVYEVTAVESGRFRTALSPTEADLFVYGREVKDFRVVDYDAIAMLNVSATQELARQVEALQASEARNAALVQRVAELEAKDRTRDTRLSAIEQLLRSSSTVMAQPAKPATASGQQ